VSVVVENKNDLPVARQHKSLLFDFYSTLLTQKQHEVFSMHYFEDNSFAEIAEEMGTSPQAVADILKRTEGRLNMYEAKLKLVEKFYNHKSTVDEINKILATMDNWGWTDTMENNKKVRELVSTLL